MLVTPVAARALCPPLALSPCAECWESRQDIFPVLKRLVFHRATKRWETRERLIFKQYVSYIFM